MQVGLDAGGSQSSALLSYIQTVILAEGSPAKQQQVIISCMVCKQC